MAFRTEKSAEKNQGEGRDPLAAQIDELQRISEVERDAKLGESWHSSTSDLYTLKDLDRPSPTFRPRVAVPQLQILTLNEATDLTDNNPRILITQRNTKKRDTDHEDALMAHWNQQFWSNEIMMAEVWALLAGIGFVQVGFDPLACRGQGRVWARVRDPKTVYPDPAALRDEDLAYVIFEDKLYLDEVRRRWPDQSSKVRPRVNARVEQPEASHKFQMPDGPMSVVSGLPTSSQPEGDGRVRVRHLYALDATIIEKDGQRQPQYPNGRYIVECEGVILADGPNPMPLGMFPLVSFIAMPRLTSYFPPSAVRYTKSLQEVAERLLTQIFENVVRMNNGLVIINEASGINIDNFGNAPSEVHTCSPQVAAEQAVSIKYPAAAVPPQIVEFPKYLFELQKMLQGFTPSRMGEPTQGNVAKDLYGMSIYESQKLTRMRGRLMAMSTQRFCELAFYTCAKFYVNNLSFPVFKADSEKFLADWNPITSPQMEDFDVYLDPSSIRPVASTVMRQLAPMLRQMGLLSTEGALEAVEWPGAAEEAAKVTNEQKLAALASITQRGKK